MHARSCAAGASSSFSLSKYTQRLCLYCFEFVCLLFAPGSHFPLHFPGKTASIVHATSYIATRSKLWGVIPGLSRYNRRQYSSRGYVERACVHGVCGDAINPVLTYNNNGICGVVVGMLHMLRIRRPKPQDQGLVVFSVMHIWLN